MSQVADSFMAIFGFTRVATLSGNVITPAAFEREEPRPIEYDCPRCSSATRQHPDPSYYGEMRDCPRCGFMGYFDQWNEAGEYQPGDNEPF